MKNCIKGSLRVPRHWIFSLFDGYSFCVFGSLQWNPNVNYSLCVLGKKKLNNGQCSQQNPNITNLLAHMKEK